MRRRTILGCLLCAIVALTLAGHSATARAPIGTAGILNLTQYVNPFTGTAKGQPDFGTGGGSADTYPGADLPFGMIQWSPDTTPNTIANQGGYSYDDTKILGFSLTHLSGAGCRAFEDIPFMPIIGAPTTSPGANRTAFAARFSHAGESAQPGYYAVRLANGISAALTVTNRTGMGSFTYPASRDATMTINTGGSVAGASGAGVQIYPAAHEVAGSATSGRFCGGGDHHTVYFVADFNQAFSAYGTWNGGALTPGSTASNAPQSGAYVSFHARHGAVVLVKVGISFVGVANARANLQAEDPGARFGPADFAQVRDAANTAWNLLLNHLVVGGGSSADTRTFYSMLYRTLLFPSACSDANGQYIGFDTRTHTAIGYTQYCNYSGWDVYRSEVQLLAMMAPQQAGDMAQSLVADARQGGALPLWSPTNMNDNELVGDPSVPIIAGIHAFGGTHFDTQGALDAMVNGAINPAAAANGVAERWGNANYLRYGYLPAGDPFPRGSAAVTLEYATADFSLARFAQALGKPRASSSAMIRAQNWLNLFDPASSFLHDRQSNGLFVPNFSFNSWIIEGDAIQYTWMVPYNLGTLFSLMGGPRQAAARLDTFFTKLNDGPTSSYAFLGNEPTLETPWEYDWAGQPYKTQRVVRQALLGLYSATPGGYPGNDDLGELSSWYVLGALGMYPEIPGDDVLALGSPLFPRATLHLTGGDVTITAAGASDQAPYVQSMTLNGQTFNQPWLRFSSIKNGGALSFKLGPSANTRWGSDPRKAPPSYTAGLPAARTAPFATNFEPLDPQPTWSNTVDRAGPPAGGSNNVGGICCGATRPALELRSELSHSSGTSLMYAGNALGAGRSNAYLEAFDVRSRAVTIARNTTLSYWIYPLSHRRAGSVRGNNSTCVAIDLILSKGKTLFNLRDSGVTDQNGHALHPAQQCDHLRLDGWNHITANLGSKLAGMKLLRIDVGYDQHGQPGGYQGYIDDISIAPRVTSFASGLEPADPRPAWTDTVDAGPLGNGGIDNVGGLCCDLSGPEAGPNTEAAHRGGHSLLYSGRALGASSDYAYAKVFDLSGKSLTVGPRATLSYWIYPLSRHAWQSVQGNNSTCVAIDLIFTDGTNLRDSRVKDQNGRLLHPASQCGHLRQDAWNHVTAKLDRVAGKTISRLDVGYDQPGRSGGYRGYIDDVAISG